MLHKTSKLYTGCELRSVSSIIPLLNKIHDLQCFDCTGDDQRVFHVQTLFSVFRVKSTAEQLLIELAMAFGPQLTI